MANDDKYQQYKRKFNVQKILKANLKQSKFYAIIANL